jgi:hypothetical protein
VEDAGVAAPAAAERRGGRLAATNAARAMAETIRARAMGTSGPGIESVRHCARAGDAGKVPREQNAAAQGLRQLVESGPRENATER